MHSQGMTDVYFIEQRARRARAEWGSYVNKIRRHMHQRHRMMLRPMQPDIHGKCDIVLSTREKVLVEESWLPLQAIVADGGVELELTEDRGVSVLRLKFAGPASLKRYVHAYIKNDQLKRML